MSTKPAYAGEAQLIRWADSLSAGRTLTLKIEEEGDLHPFKGIPAGQRMQICCVLVNDDEEPIGPDQVRKNATRHKARPKAPETKADPATAEKAKDGAVEPKRLSNLAAILCEENEDFQVWLAKQHPAIWDRHYYYEIGGRDPSPFAATATLKEVLGIKSRKELDEPGPAAESFERMRTSFKLRDMVR